MSTLIRHLSFAFFFYSISPEFVSCGSHYRLPENVIPTFYRIDLIANIADLNTNFTFSGEVWIQVVCNASTDKIVLHAKDLQIDENKVRVELDETRPKINRTLRDAESGLVQILEKSYDTSVDFFIIRLKEKLVKGNSYKIYIPFSGELTPGLAGFYRSSYKDKTTGETKWLAVTQFESIDARRAFPCFDEPAMKASFLINLGHINTKRAVSNMPHIRTEPIKGMEGWVWDSFQETVPMSTYLVAFLISDFEYLEAEKVTTNDIKFRIWARKDALEQVKFASKIGPKVLEDYELYFGIKYPLPKQDMVAVPDFSAGAMENWGLITYRETTLLYDENFTSPLIKPGIVSVIAHEIAHQWFGNLVTMKWWTDLWLNEGFATYVASLETDKLFPEWDHLNETIAENLMLVLSLDSLKTSHPISVPIEHPREIPQIFDTISYKKGSYIIRMMNLFLGEETFRTGISNYLRRHAFANAEQDDLWSSLTEEAQLRNVLPKETPLTVKNIMDSWTLQTGYPLVTVTRNYSTGEAIIRQKRYLAELQTEDSNESWYIPITYTTGNELNFKDTMPKLWFKVNDTQVSLKNISSTNWLLLNIRGAGLYRVNYDEENWKKIIKTLQSTEFSKIDVLNRVQLIDDSLNLARSGNIDYKIPFEILMYLKNEENYLPWLAATSGLMRFNKAFKDYPLYGLYKKFASTLISPIFEKTKSWKLDNIPANLQKINLQNLMFSWSCNLDIGDCRKTAAEQFKNWMNESNPDEINPIPIINRSTIYCYAIKQGGEKEWNFAWERYLKSNVGAHKSTLLRALTCTRETWLLNRYLMWSINETSGVRKQDTASVFTGIVKNDIGYYLAKKFFMSRISEISKYHGFRSNRLSAYMGSLLSRVISDYDLNEFVKFNQANQQYLQGAEKSIQRSFETASINAQWHKRYYNIIGEILQIQLQKLEL